MGGSRISGFSAAAFFIFSDKFSWSSAWFDCWYAFFYGVLRSPCLLCISLARPLVSVAPLLIKQITDVNVFASREPAPSSKVCT